jgi:periplasmic protein TonB
MDRAEKIGLSSAIGGHALLIAAFYLGLLGAVKELQKPAPITVSLVGEVAPVSSAPDAIQEEPAPAAPTAQENPADPPPSSEVMQVERPVERQVPNPLPTAISKPQPAKVAQKNPTKQSAPAKTLSRPATSGRGQTPGRPGSFSDSFEKSIDGVGKNSGQGKAVGTPAAKTASQIRSAVTVSLRNEISPYFKRCAPTGVDVDQILTSVTLNIAANGSLTGVSNIRQSGVNESNSPQAGLHKDCVIKAARAASPFQNLPADSYDLWKNWPMEFKTR